MMRFEEFLSSTFARSSEEAQTDGSSTVEAQHLLLAIAAVVLLVPVGAAAALLASFDAEHYKPDLNTDAAAMYLKSRQWPDGQWAYPTADMRQPLCLDYIGQTALAMRAASFGSSEV